MAKARPIPGLEAEESYASAAAKVVAVRARELADHSQDVLDLSDIEHLHAMRVATRRLRAALEVFEPCFDADAWSAALADVEELTDALGERRDRDVAIVQLEEFAEGLPAPDRPGVASLVGRFRGEQLAVNQGLAGRVSDERVTALHERLSELVASVPAAS